MKKGWLWFFLLLGLMVSVFAHEAYVLSKEDFAQGLQYEGFDYLSSMKNLHNLEVFITISLCIAIALLLNFSFRHSALGTWWHRKMESVRVGPLLVRLAIAISFFASAWSWSFLGPELSLRGLPLPRVMRFLLLAVSLLLFFGAFTEWAAGVALLIFTLGGAVYGAYLLTYLNYLGEIIVLLLFGSRYFSLDKRWLGPSRHFKAWHKYEVTLIRVCYGLALCYAAITVKFLHPHLTLRVVQEYNLTRFYFLFPQDPLLVVFGAALAELIIGLFIVIGFELRLTVLVSLFYITLSLLYFREAVWPHLMMYGISLSLMFSKETLTLDHYFDVHRKLAHFLKKHLV